MGALFCFIVFGPCKNQSMQSYVLFRPRRGNVIILRVVGSRFRGNDKSLVS
jgi:hypothetical protein